MSAAFFAVRAAHEAANQQPTPEELIAAELLANAELLAKAQGEVAALQDARNQLLRQVRLTCEQHRYSNGCGQSFPLSELTYIQTHWYESPHGCSGGDSWHRGEGNFICPSCGQRHRLYNKPEIQKLSHLFKDIVDEHKH